MGIRIIIVKQTTSLIFVAAMLLSLGLPLKVLAVPLKLTLQSDAHPLPEAKVDQAYEYQFQTEGGLAPLAWKIVQ